jgi:hypothetical protein
LYFVLPRSERFWNLPTKATQIILIVFSSAAQRKLLELTSQGNSNYLYFVQPHSENLLNFPTKVTQIDGILNLPTNATPMGTLPKSFLSKAIGTGYSDKFCAVWEKGGILRMLNETAGVVYL